MMISLLTLSIFFCIYLYAKHRKSLEQIKLLMVEFDKLSSDGESKQMRNGHSLMNSDFKRRESSLFDSLKQRSLFRNNSFDFILSSSELSNDLTEKNQTLLRELNIAKVLF